MKSHRMSRLIAIAYPDAGTLFAAKSAFASDNWISMKVLKKRMQDYPRTPQSIALYNDARHRAYRTGPYAPDDPYA